jgi:hypothetical protein
MFIGTQFSNLYTAVDKPKPRDVHDVCVFVRKCVYLCSEVQRPFMPGTLLRMPFLAFQRLHFASCR